LKRNKKTRGGSARGRVSSQVSGGKASKKGKNSTTFKVKERKKNRREKIAKFLHARRTQAKVHVGRDSL